MQNVRKQITKQKINDLFGVYGIIVGIQPGLYVLDIVMAPAPQRLDNNKAAPAAAPWGLFVAQLFDTVGLAYLELLGPNKELQLGR